MGVGPDDLERSIQISAVPQTFRYREMKKKARCSSSLFSNKVGVKRNYCKALAKGTILTTNT